MPRFFIDHRSVKDRILTITGEDAYHISRVLRMRAGESIEVSDCTGNLFVVSLSRITPELVEGEIIGRYPDRAEPELKVHLFQSILKGEKMDWVLQKGTEIGVSSFHPFISERTVVQKDPTSYGKKRVRWERIVLEAAKQSGRGRVPSVEPVVELNELKNISSGTIAFVAWEAEQTESLRKSLQGLKGVNEISILVGPEGGFSADEIRRLTAEGFGPVSLGPRILRAETAGPVMTALLLYEFGQMEPVGR